MEKVYRKVLLNASFFCPFCLFCGGEVVSGASGTGSGCGRGNGRATGNRGNEGSAMGGGTGMTACGGVMMAAVRVWRRAAGSGICRA